MALQSWSQLLKHGPRPGCQVKRDLSFGWQVTGRGGRNLAIILSGGLLAQAGWNPGDRLDVLFDPDTGQGELRLIQEKGWRLTRGSAKYTASLTISYRPEMGMELPERTSAEVEGVTHEAVRFKLPLKKHDANTILME